ncbi:MAG: DEAD/DEAH box helicase, partial [Clostridiales Family XIII bacterium]|nr:DEAD/DEAH box helicase [Clostridiales Family XIII bacterium]
MPIKEAVLAEISRDIPEQFKDRPGFVMNVYGCSVFEEYIDFRGFAYTAVNNDSGKSAPVERRKTPLRPDDNKVVKFALKVRDSHVGGLGRLEVAEGASLAKLRTIVRVLFREILPKYGKYKIREEQITLAEELLDAIVGRRTLLAEAPTGLGKTLVYIVIGLLIRRSKINKTWNGSYFPGMSCVEWLRMGILVSTSSIALQKAIRTEVIPELSTSLMDWGIIREPITAMLRKGREHYLCEYNLNEYLPFEENTETREELERIAFDGRVIDLADAEKLTAQVKSQISVPSKCYKNCPYADGCRYRAFRSDAKKTGCDFVICNHQLLLADMKLRSAESGAVLQPFQVLILDEAHKMLPAARSLYGSELTGDAIPAVTKALTELNFVPAGTAANDGWKVIRDRTRFLSGKLYDVNKRLFSRSDAGEQCDRTLRNIRDIAGLIYKYLSASREFKVLRDERLKHSLLWELKRISKAANELFDSGGMIRWFVAANDVRTAIGGIPKDLDEKLRADLWRRGIPAMLTSGTLSVGGDFTALKQSLGLDDKNLRLTEVTHSSPFNYRENSLL